MSLSPLSKNSLKETRSLLLNIENMREIISVTDTTSSSSVSVVAVPTEMVSMEDRSKPELVT